MASKKPGTKSAKFNTSAAAFRAAGYDPGEMVKTFTTLFRQFDGEQKVQLTGSLFHDVAENLERLIERPAGDVKSGDMKKIFGPVLELLTSDKVAPYLPANAPQMLVFLAIAADKTGAKTAFERPSVPHSFVSNIVELDAIAVALVGYAEKVKAQKKTPSAPKPK